MSKALPLGIEAPKDMPFPELPENRHYIEVLKNSPALIREQVQSTLLEAWLRSNSAIRSGFFDELLDPRRSELIRSVIPLFDSDDPEQRILCAEAHRHLGLHREAERLLDFRTPLALEQRAGFIRYLARENDILPRPVDYYPDPSGFQEGRLRYEQAKNALKEAQAEWEARVAKIRNGSNIEGGVGLFFLIAVALSVHSFGWGVLSLAVLVGILLLIAANITSRKRQTKVKAWIEGHPKPDYEIVEPQVSTFPQVLRSPDPRILQDLAEQPRSERQSGYRADFGTRLRDLDREIVSAGPRAAPYEWWKGQIVESRARLACTVAQSQAGLPREESRSVEHFSHPSGPRKKAEEGLAEWPSQIFARATGHLEMVETAMNRRWDGPLRAELMKHFMFLEFANVNVALHQFADIEEGLATLRDILVSRGCDLFVRQTYGLPFGRNDLAKRIAEEFFEFDQSISGQVALFALPPDPHFEDSISGKYAMRICGLLGLERTAPEYLLVSQICCYAVKATYLDGTYLKALRNFEWTKIPLTDFLRQRPELN